MQNQRILTHLISLPSLCFFFGCDRHAQEAGLPANVLIEANQSAQLEQFGRTFEGVRELYGRRTNVELLFKQISSAVERPNTVVGDVFVKDGAWPIEA